MQTDPSCIAAACRRWPTAPGKKRKTSAKEMALSVERDQASIEIHSISNSPLKICSTLCIRTSVTGHSVGYIFPHWSIPCIAKYGAEYDGWKGNYFLFHFLSFVRHICGRVFDSIISTLLWLSPRNLRLISSGGSLGWVVILSRSFIPGMSLDFGREGEGGGFIATPWNSELGKRNGNLLVSEKL